jgi:hypothetical protein
MTARWFSWRCCGGHHGAGPKIPSCCPLAYCRMTVVAYGEGSRKVPA